MIARVCGVCVLMHVVYGMLGVAGCRRVVLWYVVCCRMVVPVGV